MTRKIHLRQNKIDEGQTPRAVCASRSVGNGRSVPNSRQNYRFMSSPVVGMTEFLATASTNRCTHCLDMGLAWINRVRAKKGLAPVSSWAEYEAGR